MKESDTRVNRIASSVVGWGLFALGAALLGLCIAANIVEKFVTQVGTDVTSQFLWLALIPYVIASGGGIALVTNAMGPAHLPGKVGRWAFWIIALIAVILAFIEPPN